MGRQRVNWGEVSIALTGFYFAAAVVVALHGWRAEWSIVEWTAYTGAVPAIGMFALFLLQWHQVRSIASDRREASRGRVFVTAVCAKGGRDPADLRKLIAALESKEASDVSISLEPGKQWLLEHGGEFHYEVRIKNYGAGPAMNVHVFAWMTLEVDGRAICESEGTSATVELPPRVAYRLPCKQSALPVGADGRLRRPYRRGRAKPAKRPAGAAPAAHVVVTYDDHFGYEHKFYLRQDWDAELRQFVTAPSEDNLVRFGERRWTGRGID